MRYSISYLSMPSMKNRKKAQKSIKKHHIHALRGHRNVQKLLVSMHKAVLFAQLSVAENTCTYPIWRARCGIETSQVAGNGGKKGDLEH